MPLVIFDVIEGRNDTEIKELLDATHRSVRSAFSIPDRDRYQIINEHKDSHMVIDDTGLNLRRSRNMVVVRVFTSPRSEVQKQCFYSVLCHELKEHCGIEGEDIMVSIFTNDKGDWSFGNGAAQYVTGELFAK